MNASDYRQRRLHRLPCEIYAQTGYEFFFTVCARHQGKPFCDVALADAVLDSLLWTRKRYQWKLFCYCLMPDHLHFVCGLTQATAPIINAGARGFQPQGVLDHLARFKSYTTNVSWKHGLSGALWQKSSYDRVLDMQHPFEVVVAYVLDNPVRKRLVREWSEWPHSQIIDAWW